MQTDRIKADVVAYNALISAFMNGGKPDMVRFLHILNFSQLYISIKYTIAFLQAYEVWNQMCGQQEGNLTGITTSSDNISPDIITLTSVVSSLEKGNSASNKEKVDLVFAEAVLREIILPSDSMDTIWEIDLSGMSFPVARAACRYIIHRILKAVEEGDSCQDLHLITGVGKHHNLVEADTNFLLEENGDNRRRPQISMKAAGTTALREFVREILREEFQPSIYSFVAESTAGTVTAKKEVLNDWIKAQN
jgi:hypothetical protein